MQSKGGRFASFTIWYMKGCRWYTRQPRRCPAPAVRLTATTQTEGVKFIIRSDLMYRRVPAILDGPNDREAYRLYHEADERAAQGDVSGSTTLLVTFATCTL